MAVETHQMFYGSPNTSSSLSFPGFLFTLFWPGIRLKVRLRCKRGSVGSSPVFPINQRFNGALYLLFNEHFKQEFSETMGSFLESDPPILKEQYF